MAWYRAGGGGIPSSLKTGMDSVLNKKFGTSTTYPAEGWPDTVNLMGPLPEKTVSGAIVTFADGADDVPLKKCEVTIAPTLVGVSSVGVVHTGKNLIPFTADYLNFTQTQNGMTISVLSNGKVKFNGTTTALTNFSFYQASVSTAPHFYVKNGTYTFSCHGSASVNMIVSGGSNNGFPYREITNGSYTGTVTDDTKPFNYVIFRIDSGVTLSDVEVEPMLEYGSTATAYAPYVAPTTHTATLGRTIYGGSVDVVNGQGSGEWATVKLKDLTWYYSTSYGGFFHSPSIQSVVSDETYICFSSEEYTNVRLNSYQLQNTDDAIGINADNGSAVTGGAPLKSIVVKDTDYTTVADLIAHFTANDSTLCYKLATPETFTFDPVPIDSKLGNNTIWSEQGSAEVTYRADINLALGGQ